MYIKISLKMYIQLNAYNDGSQRNMLQRILETPAFSGFKNYNVAMIGILRKIKKQTMSLCGEQT